MNNKGFTLLELLATIAIMGLVFGIASYSVIGIIEKSKMRTEKAFIEKLEEAIDDYISLNTTSFVEEGTVLNDYEKCMLNDCSVTEKVDIIKFNKKNISDLVDANIIDEAKLINPANKEKCFETFNPEIEIFRDTDHVYYYYIKLEKDINNSCNINDVITNMPDTLISGLGLS